MSKHVLIVQLEIKPDAIDAFKDAVRRQAGQSLALEEGCHCFQVVQSSEQPNMFTNFEIFEDAAAFELHAKMPHTAEFGKFVESAVLNVKMQFGELVEA